MRKAGERGLTLVELLVVLVILGLVSSVVLLNAPPSREVVERDASRFASNVRTALDEMVMTGAAYRLVVDSTGYGFQRYIEGKWTADGIDRLFARIEFDRGVTAVAAIEDAALANARALGDEPRTDKEEEDLTIIRLDPIGPPATFSVRFISAEGAYVASLGADGEMSVKQDG